VAVASAQAPYDITHETVTWLSLQNGPTYMPVSYALGYPAWDEGAAAIPIPFTFRWFGNGYDTIYVYTNGFLSFTAPPSGQAQDILRAPTSVPDPRNSPHDFIAPMWRNLSGSSMREIRSAIQGSAPNRTLIIQVLGLRPEPGLDSQRVSFQVRLEEATSSVRITYHPSDVNAPSSTAGIEDARGTLGANLFATSPTCDAQCSCMPGMCSSNNYVVPNGLPDQARSIVIRPPRTAELIGAIVGPDGAYPGTMFSAAVAVTNVGLAAAGAFNATIRLSTDETIDATDTLLRTLSFPSLAAGTTSSTSYTLAMPAGLPVARYWLGLIVDSANSVTEAVETNNAVRDPKGIVTGPDLTATVIAPMSSGPGESLDLPLQVRSRGAPVRTPVGVRLLLSQDAMLDASDTEFHTASVTLPDGFALTQTVRATIPLGIQGGSYRILVEVDPNGQVTELDEANNVSASPGAITLSLPDLESQAPTAQPVAFRGLAYPVTTRVTNRGGSTARAFVVCVVISRNPLISVVSDPVLARTGPLELATGESATVRLEPVIPSATSTGAWNLAVVADCDDIISESNETNNVQRRTDTILIRDPTPDFLPVALEAPNTAASGETLPVAITVGNYGTASGAARVRVVISQNAGATTQDPVVYESPSAITLDAGREQVISGAASLPGNLSSGRYYLGAITDPEGALDEVYEDNNVVTIGPITVIGSDLAIVSPPPPAAVIGVGYVWRFAAVGGESAYQWSIEWPSGGPPRGLSFDASRAELSGVADPSAEGSHRLIVHVTSGPLSATQDAVLRVSPPTLPLSVVSARLPPALAGEPYSVQLVAVGGTPPYSWSISRGALPQGLVLGPDGEVSGEAMAVTAVTLEVRVDDAAGGSDLADIAIDVVDPNASLSITTADIPSAMVGEAFSVRFEVTGGTTPHRWRVDGTVPPGLAFDSSSAELTGTPTVAGSYPVVIEVRDARGLLDRNAYVLRVFELGELTIVTGRSADDQLPHGKVGAPYVGATGPVVLRAVRRDSQPVVGLGWMLALGALPNGLSLDPETGVIAGVPTTEGVSAFTVIAHDASGDRDRVTLAIVIDPAEGTTNQPGDEGCGCSATHAQSRSWIGLLAIAIAIGWCLVRRRRGIAALLFACVPWSAIAQPIPYVVTRESAAYQPLTNGTRVQPELADGTTIRVPLPFEVSLYGNSSRDLYVNANGLVALVPIGNGNHFPPDNSPNTSPPNGFVAALWSDWCSGGANSCPFPSPVTGAGVYYAIDPTLGAGSVTVEYRMIRHFSDDAMPTQASFQIKLYEGAASRIELHYGPIIPGVDFGGDPSDLTSRIGIESFDGRTGMWLDPCADSDACDTSEVQALSGTRVRLVADAGRDVALSAVSTPAVGYPDILLPISARVFSRHGEVLGPFVVAAYLLGPTASSTVGAPRIALSDPITLSAYESIALMLDGSIPSNTAPSRYRIALVADALDEISETFEDNNLALSPVLRIAGRGPDLTVTAARLIDTSAQPGSTVRLSYRVQNAGNEPGRAELRAYLSQNSALSPSDRSLGSPVMVDLAPGRTITGTLSGALADPHPGGLFHAGLIVDPSGMLTELDETNNTLLASDRVAVVSGGVEILTDALPPATLTQSYSVRIEASGGEGSPVISIVQGALPRGLAFEEGAIFGVPLETGSFPIQLEAVSGASRVVKDLELVVIDPAVPLTIVTSHLPLAIVGSDYLAEILYVGGVPPFGFRIFGSLPAGLALATDGAILGVPTTPGPSSFTVEIKDNAGATATAAYSLEVRAPGNLIVLTESLPPAVVGVEYDARLLALGGAGALRWRSLSDLPPGLTISELGELSGTPEQVGEYQFTVGVQDEAASVDTNRLVLVVEPSGRLRMVTEQLPPATVGVPYRGVIRAEGGTRPYVWTFERQEGSLPDGFVAGPGDVTRPGESDQDLVIAGTLDKEGLWPFTLRVRDDRGQTVERPFAIVGSVPPPVIEPEEEGCGCTVSGVERVSPTGVLISLVLLMRRQRRGSFGARRGER
jgi:subtilase family serine protease